MKNAGLILSAGIGAIIASITYYFNKPVQVDPIPQLGEIETVLDQKVHVYHKKHAESKLLMVFIHGFAGQMYQFEQQIKEFEKKYSILAIDLTGQGYTPISTNPQQYHLARFAALVSQVIKQKRIDEKVFLVCHSYGACVGTKVWQSTVVPVDGIIFLCPKLEWKRKEIDGMKWFLSFPDWVLNMFRWLDRFGGLNSGSVKRLFGRDASEGMKRKQYAFNISTPTPVIRLISQGLVEFGEHDFKGFNVPLLVVFKLELTIDFG
jgi:pimeloyl-ACP methyl ester carboxylesterase